MASEEKISFFLIHELGSCIDRHFI